MELARALIAHYKGEDRKKDENQLEIPFDKEQVIKIHLKYIIYIQGFYFFTIDYMLR